MIDKARLFRVDRRRILFAALFVSLFVLTEIGRRIYRPYIYAHEVFDFWIADTIGNFTGTMTIVFFELAILNPEWRRGRPFLLLIPVGLVAYELAQVFSPRSVCDWKDILATLIAGLLAWGMYEWISHRTAHTQA